MTLYRLVLRFYPRRFRAEFETSMVQLFRDQWRDVRDQGGWMSWIRSYSAQVFDLCAALVREHCSEIIDLMKTKQIAELSLVLLISAVVCDAPVAPVVVRSGWAPLCLYISLLLLAGRALVEWRRPSRQWFRGLGWAVVLLLLYGLILPFWFKMNVIHGSAYPSVPLLSVGLVLTNAIVPMARVLRHLFTHLSGQNQAP